MKRQKFDVAKEKPLYLLLIVFLRVLIGWHFLYEGLSKIFMGTWTCAPFLQNSRWLLADVFHAIAANPTLLKTVDLLNMWGLTLIGLALLLGLFTRLSSILGILLLTLYYVANPPFIGMDFGLPAEGHYLIVNKNLIEMFALLAVAWFPAGYAWGLDRLVFAKRYARKDLPAPMNAGEATSGTAPSVERREILKSLATLPILGGLIYGTVKKTQWEKVNAVTGATIKLSDTKLKDLKGELPKGKIKDFEISRVIMGGNLIGGWAHARDLIYASQLFKAYNTERKIFETLSLGEKAGINSMNLTGSQLPVVNKYRRLYNSKLQVICQVHPTKDKPHEDIDYAIDNGANILQIQGNDTDARVRDNELDVLVNAIDYIRRQGYVAGLGAHSIQALIACDEAGIIPDFYMKTLHDDNYWSAHPKENRLPFDVISPFSPDHDHYHNNMFCLFPDETVAFLQDKKIPVIGFKVLAAGAIHPKEGFKFAFENGADFICVGMFDWQIVGDVNIALDTLANLPKRTRPWCA